MENEIAVQFLFEKTTKNTVRFMEIPLAGQEPVCGSIYVKKSALGKNIPKGITITIKTHNEV
jgi:hypothetical protein